MARQPTTSCTIWSAQRVGRTALCRALADTGIAGRPLGTQRVFESEPSLDRGLS